MDTSGARTLQLPTSVAVGTVVLATSTVSPVFGGGGAANITLTTGATVNGILVLPGSGVHFQVVLNGATPAANVWEIVGGANSLPIIYPGILYTGSVTLTAFELMDRKFVSSGAVTLTMPSAAAIVAGIPGIAVGDTLVLYAASLGGTLTIAAGTGGNLFGTATVAAATAATFILTMSNVTTVPAYDMMSVTR